MNYRYDLRRDKADDRDLKFSSSISIHPMVQIPKSVDLRPKCPSVYDQGNLGSCTANAGCACRVMLLGQKELELSRLFLYYEERILEGKVRSDSGASLRDTCKAAHKAGICEEKYMPYDVRKFAQPPSREALINARKYDIHAYKSLGSLDEIKQSISLRQQPVMLGMDVYESLEAEPTAKTGKMQMPGPGERKLGGHAVLVVGYMDSTQDKRKHKMQGGHLIVRNSWGENCGDKGYFYMPYEYVSGGYTYDYWIMES